MDSRELAKTVDETHLFCPKTSDKHYRVIYERPKGIHQQTGPKKRRRLVEKDGFCNVSHNHHHRRGFLTDIFTTLVDIQWRYNLTIFTLAYCLSWLGFGIVWYLIALSHGDLQHIDSGPGQEWVPCVYNVHSFTTALLFSIETQTTIGYGYRTVTDQCWFSILVVVIQSVFSCMVDAVMIGCVFAKIARPKKRAETLIFSKTAVVGQRDGRLCLMFRVGDIRRSHLLEAHIRAQLIRPRVTQEGETIPLYHHDVDLGFDNGLDRIFLVWPLIICHVIDETSPFYEMSPADFNSSDYELVVILEGIVEATGMTTQKRTSYTPEEIRWGHRFDSNIVALSTTDNAYHIDYHCFDRTLPIPIPIPKLSAKEVDRLHQQSQAKKCGNGVGSPATPQLIDRLHHRQDRNGGSSSGPPLLREKFESTL